MSGGILITGASSGIGAALTRRLSRAGFVVFGTIRKPADAAVVERDGGVPVVMDVTQDGTIAAARGAVEHSLAGRPLVALVNNAGIAVAGPLEHLPLGELRRVLETNVVGVIAVTQAFLPLLRRTPGRVVNISSISGRMALPFGGPYAASKFALEALSDSLRRELIPSGIKVVVVQPGSILTPIWDKLAGIDLAHYRETSYAPVLPRVLEDALRRGRGGLPADRVATAVLRAVTDPNPPTRILVVRRPLLTRVARLLPDRWIDRGVRKALWEKEPGGRPTRRKR
ncbi:MAG TPA: SDR family oxidoreductase [Gemmatimonadales bacterium]|nr:SDR family oxidoreductase [Gemmatimonadales bacterium]